MYTLFILSSFVLNPPNITVLLSSTAVKVKWEHGGGLSPMVAGQLHTPVHTMRAVIIGHMLLIRTLKHIVTTIMKGTEVQNPRRFAYVHVEYMYVCK